LDETGAESVIVKDPGVGSHTTLETLWDPEPLKIDAMMILFTVTREWYTVTTEVPDIVVAVPHCVVNGLFTYPVSVRVPLEKMMLCT